MHRTHFRLSEEHLVENESYAVECGAELKHAHFEFCWDAESDAMEGMTRTIGMCQKCMATALKSVSGRRYIYGLSEAAEVK